MTTKVTCFDAKVDNTDKYTTNIDIKIGMRLDDEQSVQYLLTVTKNGCQIKRVEE